MSSLLYGPGSETLAVVVLNSQELGRIGPTAALSVAAHPAGRRAGAGAVARSGSARRAAAPGQPAEVRRVG